jgi:CBS domain-containing protein
VPRRPDGTPPSTPAGDLAAAIVLPPPPSRVDAPTVDVDALVRDVAAAMARTGTARVTVVEDERVLGVVSDRDLVVRALAEGLDPMSTSVGDVLELV